MSLPPVWRSVVRDRPKVVLVTVLVIIITIFAVSLCQCDRQRRRRGHVRTDNLGDTVLDGFKLDNCGRFKSLAWQERQNAFSCEPFKPKNSFEAMGAPASRQTRDGRPSEIQIQELPFYALLIVKNDKYEINCSGTLVDYEFVVTTARCVFEAKQIIVRLGTTNKNFVDGLNATKADRLCYLKDFHPDVNSLGDLAVLRLKDRVDYSDTVQPACLPQIGQPNERAACLVARKPPSGSTLQHLQKHIVRRHLCPSNLSDSYAHLCFQTQNKNLGFCKLELGTPVVCYDACIEDSSEVRAFVVGVESFAPTPGNECDPEVSTPLLYTDLNRVSTLIKSMSLTLIDSKHFPPPSTVKCYEI